MKFFARFNKFFGIVRVRERNNLIYVTGIDGLVMRKYIKVMFETDVVSKQMFTRVDDTSIVFNNFFIPDFLFMITKLRASTLCGWAGRRTIDKIIHGLMTDTWFKITTKPVVSMVDPSRRRLLKWKPLQHQEDFLLKFGDLMPRYDLRGYIAAFAPGLGKAQSLDSLVLTDKGWVRMGDITLDTKVVCPDGTHASVTGIFPQGVKDIYRITLVDDRSAECCDDHLWKVWSPVWTNPWVVKPLKEFRGANYPIYIPTTNENQTINGLSKLCSVEYAGKKEAQCIMIDHPDHLYITNDYIVTHNTFVDLLVATCVIPLEIAEVKIIISPKKAVHLVWEKTIKTVFHKPPTCWVTGSGIKMPFEGVEYYVFNFEQLDNAIALGKHLAMRNIRYFVIVDESHNFADHKSQRTQKLVQLQTIRNDIYFLWTSGSPILKNGAELISFLKCSDPRFDTDAENRFRKIYSASPGRANEIFNHRLGQMMAFILGKTAAGASKPTIKELPIRLPPSIANQFLMSSVREEMKQFIKQRMVFYADNIKQYRDIVVHGLNLHEHTLKTRADRQAFDVYQKNLKMIMQTPDRMLAEPLASARQYERTKLLPSLPPLERKAFRNALSAVKNIKLKVRGEALGTVLSKRRSECAAQLGLFCKPDQIMKESLSKTMFFASSVLPVKLLEQYLKKKGFDPLLVYAGTNANLTANIEAFTTDPNINPICATMQSLSEAVPVIAASTVVLLNRPFRQATWEQVIARADRMGQVHPVTVIEVTLDTGDEPNVSSTTDNILATVRVLINEIVGADFAGPNPDDRVYNDLIDASKEDPAAFLSDLKLDA